MKVICQKQLLQVQNNIGVYLLFILEMINVLFTSLSVKKSANTNKLLFNQKHKHFKHVFHHF